MENNNNRCINRNECIETTFKQMGIRASKGVAEHILKDNAYEDNLISDISTVDYTKGNKGKTHLQEIPGFGIFVDDLYVYGYLRKEDIVYNRVGGIQCTTGANGSASYIIEQIRAIVKYTLGRDNPSSLHTSIMHTIALDKKSKGTILETIDKIEKNTNVIDEWKEYNNVEEAAAAFVIKVDVSNIPLEKLQNNILDLEIKLLGIGYAIYCVDYTQDYSGTMQRDKLINYFLENLPFRMQGGDYIPDAEYTILDNVQSVGRNVLSFIHENEKTKNLHRVKLYNKIVSNFEAGEVRSCMGGH